MQNIVPVFWQTIKCASWLRLSDLNFVFQKVSSIIHLCKPSFWNYDEWLRVTKSQKRNFSKKFSFQTNSLQVNVYHECSCFSLIRKILDPLSQLQISRDPLDFGQKTFRNPPRKWALKMLSFKKWVSWVKVKMTIFNWLKFLLQAIFELVCGEEDLVNDLLMIQKNYSDPLMHLNILNHAEVWTYYFIEITSSLGDASFLKLQIDLVFGKLKTIIPIHKDFYSSLLKRRCSRSGVSSQIGQTLVDWVDSLKDHYLDYCYGLIRVCWANFKTKFDSKALLFYRLKLFSTTGEKLTNTSATFCSAV